MKLWQLKKLSTNETLNSPQKLPINWGPIFGLAGVEDKLGDLSWVGINDQGWFVVGEEPDPVSPSTYNQTPSEIQWARTLQLLGDSDWSVLPDVPMTNGKKTEWLEYRKALREIKLQEGFPDTIHWPNKPE